MEQKLKNGAKKSEKLSKGPLWNRAFDDLTKGRLFSYFAMVDSTNIINPDKQPLDVEKFQNWKPNGQIMSMHVDEFSLPLQLTSSMELDSPIIQNIMPKSRRPKPRKEFITKKEPFAPVFTTAKTELDRQCAVKGRQPPTSGDNGNRKIPRFMAPGQSGATDESGIKGMDKKLVELIESEIIDSKSKISWDDIAGLHTVKDAIHYAVINPMKRPELFRGIRAAPKGVLLFGPPGTGKTLVGKCIAGSTDATFFSISASSLTSKWIGEGEKLVRVLFAIARKRAPSVVFVDEIDSLLSMRSDGEHESSRRIKTEFLVQLDGCRTDEDEDKFVLLIGATNRPECLDEAARRRLTKRLYVPLPCPEARQQIIQKLMVDQQHTLNNNQISTLVNKTNGYSGADINSLCREAALAPLKTIGCLDNIDCITARVSRPK